MGINNAFSGVGVAGVSRTLPVAQAAAAAAHPAFVPDAAWGAVAMPQRKRHNAIATAPSVARGST